MDSMYIDYDNSLIGRIPYVEAYNFYGADATNSNQQRALSCIRYAIEEILGWDEDEAIKKFDEYIINEMKLIKVIAYIDYPTEVPYGDPKYILSLLYPDKIKMNQGMLIENVYKSVLEGNGKQFPREYFIGGIGFKRFCFCVKYLLENYKIFSDLESIYDFFNSAEGKKFLYDYRLKVPADQFSINIIDVIHYITKDEPNSDLYYTYYLYKNELESFN